MWVRDHWARSTGYYQLFRISRFTTNTGIDLNYLCIGDQCQCTFNQIPDPSNIPDPVPVCQPPPETTLQFNHQLRLAVFFTYEIFQPGTCTDQ
jgi:hypothetical protein